VNYEQTTEADKLTASLQDDEVKRGDHIIVTDEDGDESKWLVVWADDHEVLGCQIVMGRYSDGLYSLTPNSNETYESYIDLRNPREFTIDETTAWTDGTLLAVRKEQV
tara:strand:- start:541 stop:864 length:324 start_codon:yes stop_codon:yes gene_type:complete